MDITAKLKAYLQLGQRMRDAQKEFFVASSKRDFARKNAILPKAKALEKIFDESTAELQQLLDQGFQPELFQ